MDSKLRLDMATENCDPECQRKYLDRSIEIVKNKVIEFNISYINLLDNYKQSVAKIHARDKQVRRLFSLLRTEKAYVWDLEMKNNELKRQNNELALYKNNRLLQERYDNNLLNTLKTNNEYSIEWGKIQQKRDEILTKALGENYREELKTNRDNYKTDSLERISMAELSSSEKIEMRKLDIEELELIQDFNIKIMENENPSNEITKIKKLNGKLLSRTDKFHTYVSGSSGGGKSEIIKTLIKHHLKSPRKAVIIIDPKNDLAEQVAKFKDNDPDRLVYIHPKLDASKTFVFNPFDLPEQFIDDHRSLIQESLLNSFEIMLGKELSDPMKAFLSPCIDLMLDHPDGSFKILRSLLKGDKEQINDSYDKKLEMFTKNYFNGTYDSTKDAIIRRLDFLLQSDFSKVTTGKITIKLRELIKENKLVIFNLKGLAHKEALGALILAQIQSITMARHVDDIKNKTYLIIDECHNFITPSVDKILSEGRSSSLFLVLANQYLKQIKRENIATSVKTNTSLKIIARQTDSITAKELGAIIEVSPDKLRVLKPKKGECYIRIESAKAILVRNKSKLIDDSFAMTDDEWNGIVEQQLTKYYTLIIDEPTEDYSNVRV